MSTETTPTPKDEVNQTCDTPQKQPEPGPMKKIWNFFVELVKTFFMTVRALLFLIIKTPYVLVPTSTHSSSQDDEYSKNKKQELIRIINRLDINEHDRCVIIKNWIDQISWTSGRANRERDANELTRWWQIILGVLIPVLANIEIEIVSKELLISAAGIFVAILTAVAQFRRPEERWRHYRVINERYTSELWQFVALSGVYQEFRDDETRRHKAAFPVFDARMTAIRTEDLTKFFNEVVPPRQRPQAEEEEGTPPGTGGEVP